MKKNKKKLLAGILALALISAQILLTVTAFADADSVDSSIMAIGDGVADLNTTVDGLDRSSFKQSGQEVSEVIGGVTWKGTINGDGNVEGVWTDSANISGCIKDGVLIIPSLIENASVVSIGKGDTSMTPVVASEATGSYNTVSIPYTASAINAYAFYGNRKITNLLIEPNIVSIGNNAFEGASALKTLTVAERRTGHDTARLEIKQEAFKRSALRQLYLTGCEDVYTEAFSGTGLTGVYIPAGTRLDSKAFYGCNDLKAVRTGASLAGNVFEGCNNISYVYGEDTVESIAYNWNGDQPVKRDMTVCLSAKTTLTMKHINGQYISPLGLQAYRLNAYCITNGTETPAGLQKGFQLTPDGTTLTANMAAITLDSNGGTSAFSEGSYSAWYAPGLLTVTAIPYGAAPPAYTGTDPTRADVFTAEYAKALYKGYKLNKGNVNVTYFDPKGTKVTYGTDKFYVVRRSAYDDNMTKEEIAGIDDIRVTNDDVIPTGDSGLIKAKVIVYKTDSEKEAIDILIRVENKTPASAIIGNKTKEKATIDIENAIAKANKLSADIAKLKKKDGLTEKNISVLDGYEENIGRLLARLNKMKDVIDKERISLSNASITISTNEIVPDSTNGFKAPGVEVTLNGYKVPASGYTKDEKFSRDGKELTVKITGVGDYKDSATEKFDMKVKPSGRFTFDMDDADFDKQIGSGQKSSVLSLTTNPDKVGSILRTAAKETKDKDNKTLEDRVKLENVTLRVDMSDSSDTMQADEKKIKDKIKNNQKLNAIASTFDISIVAEADSGDEINVSQTESPLHFEVSIPAEVRGLAPSEYGIMTVHNGGEPTYVSDITIDGNTIGFDADRFSTYSIVYTDPDHPTDQYTVTLAENTYKYTGKEIKPTVTVVYNDTTPLIQDTHFTVTYKNNVNVGQAFAVVKGIASTAYAGLNVELPFVILNDSGGGGGGEAKDVSKVTSAIYGASSYTYTTKAIKPSVLVMDDATELVKDIDYSLTYQDNINAGTATIVIQGLNEYIKYRAERMFNIDPKDIGGSGVSFEGIEDQDIDDGDKATLKDLKIKYNGKTLKKGTDYTVSYTNNKKKGTATATITGTGNYTGSVDKDFEVDVKKKSSSSSSNNWSASSSMMPGTAASLAGATTTADGRLPVDVTGTVSLGNATVKGGGGGNGSASPKTNDISTMPVWAGIVLFILAASGLVIFEEFRKPKHKNGSNDH